ncbi:MAG: hypothetical protein JW736_05265 [Deltaproteobacteria bacterium]|nr:hypothetical protein [Deltaproteobacteria bacterium]MBN2687728.1 hypothetical protein [Deltaproteobacteria bacterium]
MKKIILLCEIVLVIVVLAKIAAISGVMVNLGIVDRYLSVREAFAEPAGKAPEQVGIRDVSVDRLLKERELLASLMKQKEELDRREENLRNDEHQIGVLKQELITRMEQLKELEGKLSVLVESIKEVEGEKYQDLAKIYEACPPAHAGTMLERMDVETAAAIIMNMRSKNAGAVLEHIKTERAMAITEKITHRSLSK